MTPLPRGRAARRIEAELARDTADLIGSEQVNKDSTQAIGAVLKTLGTLDGRDMANVLARLVLAVSQIDHGERDLENAKPGQ